jgi:hypothetical protein
MLVTYNIYIFTSFLCFYTPLMVALLVRNTHLIGYNILLRNKYSCILWWSSPINNIAKIIHNKCSCILSWPLAVNRFKTQRDVLYQSNFAVLPRSSELHYPSTLQAQQQAICSG